MTCRCDGSGWLPEMCVGRWRCPCADGYTKNARNAEAFEHVEQLCAKCEAMREKREVNMCDYIKAEAERLPNGTAAKALRMMQPATVTITISREDAEEILGSEYGCSECNGIAEPPIAAVRAAPEEGR